MQPTELLSLFWDNDLIHTAGDLTRARMVFRLGSFASSTKGKRQHFAMQFASRDPLVFRFPCEFVAASDYGSRLFPFSVDVYCRLLALLPAFVLGPTITFCPHGPRAGSASRPS